MNVIIDGVTIGAAFPPQILADIDVYFKRDVDKANRLIDVIAQSGCRFLKGAILSRADVCVDSDEMVTYFDKERGQAVQERYSDVTARHLVPLETLAKVLAHGRARGLSPILSVYDEEGVAFALAQGAVAIKIPSSNIVHLPLIRAAASAGLPLLIDTGRSRLDEIDRACACARASGAEGRLIVEHSPPGPPAGAERFHLRMLPFLAQRFQCPVGLSDHAIGLDMLPLAVALGASIFEKGLVNDGASLDIDVAHALSHKDLPRAVDMIRQSWLALGSAPRPESELPTRSLDRMGLVARQDLAPGDRIEAGKVGFAYPPLGIPVEHWDDVVGQVLLTSVAAGQPVSWSAVRSDGDAK